MGWYRVTKTIKGHKYLYEQQTYREGGKVKTRNRYLGPAGSDGSSGSSKSAVTTTDSSLLHGAASFGQAMLKQFDAGQWGRDVAAQMGTGTAKSVTTTKRTRQRRKIFLGYHEGKRHFIIAKGSKYERQKPPPDEVWFVLQAILG